MLANGPQGAHFHQLTGRTHEHGREVETEDRLRACSRRIAVKFCVYYENNNNKSRR